MKIIRFETEKLISFIARYKGYLLMSVISFMFIHGEMAFNKLSWHDDIEHIRGLAEGMLTNGRFTYQFMADFLGKYSGIESLPVIHCLIGATCLSLIGIILIDMFHIDHKLCRASILVICISLPAVAGNLGYMTTFGFNMIGALLTVIAAFITLNRKGYVSALGAIVLLILSIGEYQCYITLFLAILFCGFMQELLTENNSDKDIQAIILRCAVISVAGLVGYIIVLRLILLLSNTELSSYANIKSFGITSASGYIARIQYAYKDFLRPQKEVYSMFPFNRGIWHHGLLALLSMAFLLRIEELFRRHRTSKAIWGIVLFLIVPLVYNLNHVIYGSKSLHSLHQLQFILLPVLIVVILNTGICKYKNIIIYIASLYITIIGVLYIRYDNMCYMQAEIYQQQSLSYLTTLISDIHNTEKYSSSIPVCYVNENKRNASVHEMSFYDTVVTNPYNVSPANVRNWQVYLYEWCNFRPESVIEFENLSYNTKTEIESMPHYPDSGSIKVIENVLVVNF